MPSAGGGVLKVPHMGWNEVEVVGDPPALRGIPSGTYFYFVHSYYASPSDPGDVACRSTYGVPFAAAVGRGNRLPPPPAPPRRFVEAVASGLHVVDLDGAFLGKPVNAEIICRIATVAGVPVQVGGGVRNYDSASRYFAAGG